MTELSEICYRLTGTNLGRNHGRWHSGVEVTMERLIRLEHSRVGKVFSSSPPRWQSLWGYIHLTSAKTWWRIWEKIPPVRHLSDYYWISVPTEGPVTGVQVMCGVCVMNGTSSGVMILVQSEWQKACDDQRHDPQRGQLWVYLVQTPSFLL